jgi:uncharacterized protein
MYACNSCIIEKEIKRIIAFTMKFYLILFGLIFKMFIANGQSNALIQNKILQNHFQIKENGLVKKRIFLPVTQKYNPIQYVSSSLIYFYQNFLSEQIQADCTYDISCSQYLKLCIAKYGFLKGTAAGLNQYTKCNTNNSLNHLPYKLNDKNKIINDVVDEKN